MEREIAYEWVLTFSKGEDIVLTEKQYQLYCAHAEDNFISFDNFGFNPAYVIQVIKRPAERLKDYYPCETCHASGWEMKDGKRQPCSKCKGTGLDLPR